ncbi:MAG: TIGR02710 family CRISPR-associated CARF protein [Thiohalomonadaceae bacterium]
MTHILICTVGGSHQPIVTTINELRPDYVCFVCTDKDPTTGQPGSRVQIEGKGNIIKASFQDTSPTLPNIPSQCQLEAEQYGLLIVPADDLDRAYALIAERATALSHQYPDALIHADYTGGTKTMTAALVMAAIEHPTIELRLVTGARGDLKQVHDGTEFGTPAMADGIRLRRAMAPYLSAWQHHGYAEAAHGLGKLTAPREPALRAELQIARDLSQAFDAWDRFAHQQAMDKLRLYRPRIGKQLGLSIKFLEQLCLDDGEPLKEPAQLLDLWRNAQRRALQGRYDDAVARGYRLLEWTAQWLLRSRAGIDTGDLQPEQLPADMHIAPGRDGTRKAGLFDAWRLVAHHLPGIPGQFAKDESKRMLDHLKARNQSILAHGFSPIDADTWHPFSTWLDDAFIPMLSQCAAEAGLRLKPSQLPIIPPWE